MNRPGIETDRVLDFDSLRDCTRLNHLRRWVEPARMGFPPEYDTSDNWWYSGPLQSPEVDTKGVVPPGGAEGTRSYALGVLLALADRLDTEAQRVSVRDWLTLACLPTGDQATENFAGLLDLPALGSTPVVDWDRWHELLDLRDSRALTPEEQLEYAQIAEVVSRLDEEEAQLGGGAVDALVRKHERVLDSIERLTEAVNAAADRLADS